MSLLSSAASSQASFELSPPSSPESPRHRHHGSGSFNFSNRKFVELPNGITVCIETLKKEHDSLSKTTKTLNNQLTSLSAEQTTAIARDKSALSNMEMMVTSIKAEIGRLGLQKHKNSLELSQITSELTSDSKTCQAILANITAGIADPNAPNAQHLHALAQKISKMSTEKLQKTQVNEEFGKSLSAEIQKGRKLEAERDAKAKETQDMSARYAEESKALQKRQVAIKSQMQSLQLGMDFLKDLHAENIRPGSMKRKLIPLRDLSMHQSSEDTDTRRKEKDASGKDEKSSKDAERGSSKRSRDDDSSDSTVSKKAKSAEGSHEARRKEDDEPKDPEQSSQLIPCDKIPKLPAVATFASSHLHRKILERGLTEQSFKKYLLEWKSRDSGSFKAAINQTVSGYRPIQLLILSGSIALVKVFLEHLPNLDCVVDGYNVLQLVALSKQMNERGVASIVEHLLKNAGFIPHAFAYENTPPTHLSAYNNNHHTLNALLSLREKVDINETDAQGYAPIHYAALGNRQALQVILEHPKTEVNLTDPTGRTALHEACEFGLYEKEKTSIVTDLLTRHANPDLKDKSGCTPLDYAKNPGPLAIKSFFIGKDHPDRVALYRYLRDDLGALAIFKERKKKPQAGGSAASTPSRKDKTMSLMSFSSPAHSPGAGSGSSQSVLPRRPLVDNPPSGLSSVVRTELSDDDRTVCFQVFKKELEALIGSQKSLQGQIESIHTQHNEASDRFKGVLSEMNRNLESLKDENEKTEQLKNQKMKEAAEISAQLTQVSEKAQTILKGVSQGIGNSNHQELPALVKRITELSSAKITRSQECYHLNTACQEQTEKMGQLKAMYNAKSAEAADVSKKYTKQIKTLQKSQTEVLDRIKSLEAGMEFWTA
jgi:ankyrin repeat protein